MRWRRADTRIVDEPRGRFGDSPGCALASALPVMPKVTGSDEVFGSVNRAPRARPASSPARARRAVSAHAAAIDARRRRSRHEELDPDGARLARRHVEGKGAPLLAGERVDVGHERVGPRPGVPLDRRRRLHVEIVDAVQARRGSCPAPSAPSLRRARRAARPPAACTTILKRLPLAARRFELRLGLARRHRRRETLAPSARRRARRSSRP